MNYVHEVLKDTAIGVSVGKTPEKLSTIHDLGCAASIWQRQPLERLQNWIDTLEPAQLPCARLTLSPEAVRDATFEICEMSGTPESAERNLLMNDIATLANIFAKQMSAKWLRLRLDMITTNACQKFHIDAVTARLICTYRGTVTQYGISTNGADPSQVFTVPTGAPILLRGSLWPEHPKSGLRHRSPPIEGTDETRLVLVLDLVDYPAEKPNHQLVH